MVYNQVWSSLGTKDPVKIEPHSDDELTSSMNNSRSSNVLDFGESESKHLVRDATHSDSDMTHSGSDRGHSGTYSGMQDHGSDTDRYDANASYDKKCLPEKMKQEREQFLIDFREDGGSSQHGDDNLPVPQGLFYNGIERQRELSRLRQRARRARMTDKERAVDRHRKQARRANMTEEERAAQKEKDRERARQRHCQQQQARRAAMTEEERAAQKEKDRVRARQRRALLSEMKARMASVVTNAQVSTVQWVSCLSCVYNNIVYFCLSRHTAPMFVV
jgi:hypothetical protein